MGRHSADRNKQESTETPAAQKESPENEATPDAALFGDPTVALYGREA